MQVSSMASVSQFGLGHSFDKCGFYAVSTCKYAGRPGQVPAGSPLMIAQWADSQYVAYDGPDIASNGNGMTVPELYNVILAAGLHYQGIGSQDPAFSPERLTADFIRAWLRLGYPVILAVWEANVVDLDLGRCPYDWDTSGLSHIIVANGISDDTNLLCFDSASVDANGVRPGPRRYDAGRLEQGLLSATVVVLPWLTRPNPNFDPTKGSDVTMGIPAGWTYDEANAKLTDPHGGVIWGGGACGLILSSHWDPANTLITTIEVPFVLVEDHRWGPGRLFIFEQSVIVVAYHPDPALTNGKTETNVVILMPIGREIAYLYANILNQPAPASSPASPSPAIAADLAGVVSAEQKLHDDLVTKGDIA